MLLDTGTAGSVVLSSFVNLSQLVDTGKCVTTWTTMAGSFTTRKVAMLHFKMPELSTSKEVKWPCQVDEHTDRKSTPRKIRRWLKFVATSSKAARLRTGSSGGSSWMSWSGTCRSLRERRGSRLPRLCSRAKPASTFLPYTRETLGRPCVVIIVLVINDSYDSHGI